MSAYVRSPKKCLVSVVRMVICQTIKNVQTANLRGRPIKIQEAVSLQVFGKQFESWKIRHKKHDCPDDFVFSDNVSKALNNEKEFGAMHGEW